MQVPDVLPLVGEVLSWIGLGLGVPLLLLAALIRVVEGRWLDVEIAIVDRDGSPVARWFAGGDFHERPLRSSESAVTETGWTEGVVSSNDPAHARVGEPPHTRRVLVTLGIVFCSVGSIGLVASLVPLFL